MLLLHYHVPILPLDASRKYELRDHGGGIWYFGIYNNWITPDTYAKLMTVLNILMWPLVLTFWARRLLRP